MVDMLQYLWSIVGYDHKYISPTWRASVAAEHIVVPAIATPYYHNGNIFDYVSLYANADLLNLMYQASSAFVHIHSKNIVHGDICPVSFLLVSWH
jgi:serine/threonine protein kinase